MVTVQSDHRPLEAIFKKPLELAPARLQRMLLYLQKFNLDVQYVRGKHMSIADTLSRANLTEDMGKSNFVNSLEVVNYQDTLVVGVERLDEFKLHTVIDADLQGVSHMITDGWPEGQKETPFATRAYFN